MKLPKYGQESSLITPDKRHLKYKQSCHIKNKSHYFQYVINSNPFLNNHLTLPIPDLSQNHTRAFQHIYPPVYQVYITSNPTH